MVAHGGKSYRCGGGGGEHPGGGGGGHGGTEGRLNAPESRPRTPLEGLPHD